MARPTAIVVPSALGALTGSTSSSTSPTTASARAKATKTTNAYMFLPPSAAPGAPRTPGWTHGATVGYRIRRGNLRAIPRKARHGRRPGAGAGLPARRARRARRADPGDVRRRLRTVPADARRPGGRRRRDPGGLPAGGALRAGVSRRVELRHLAAPGHGQRVPERAAQAGPGPSRRRHRRRRGVRDTRRRVVTAFVERGRAGRTRRDRRSAGTIG